MKWEDEVLAVGSIKHADLFLMEICYYNFHTLEICHWYLNDRWVPPSVTAMWVRMAYLQFSRIIMA
jgi:hypothetical protein